MTPSQHPESRLVVAAKNVSSILTFARINGTDPSDLHDAREELFNILLAAGDCLRVIDGPEAHGLGNCVDVGRAGR